MNDRQADLTSQIFGLIETARAPPTPMQRHRHDDVRAVDDVASVLPHQLPQRFRERPATVVLQRVHDRSQRSGVRPDGAAAAERRRAAAASRARRRRDADHAPRGKRCPAALTLRRREADDGVPALTADGSARRLGKGTLARGTGRREGDGEQPVDEKPQRFTGRRERDGGLVLTRSARARR